jgi:hypothetical protein
MNIRSLILGSVAALALVTSAHATDAVVADQPNLLDSQDVQACDAYGKGFAKLPGTDTCMRISGQIRYEKHFSSGPRATSSGRTTLDFETRGDLF